MPCLNFVQGNKHIHVFKLILISLIFIHDLIINKHRLASLVIPMKALFQVSRIKKVVFIVVSCVYFADYANGLENALYSVI